MKECNTITKTTLEGTLNTNFENKFVCDNRFSIVIQTSYVITDNFYKGETLCQWEN